MIFAQLLKSYVAGRPDLTPAYIASQALSVLAFILGNLAYWQKNDRLLKIILGSSAYVNGLHYIFLARRDGFWLSIAGGTRHILAGLYPKASFFWLFILLGTAFGIYYWKDWRDIFSILANILACVAVYRNEGLVMRRWLTAGTFCWFIYAVLSYSIIGAAVEAFYIANNLLTMRRIARENSALNSV